MIEIDSEVRRKSLDIGCAEALPHYAVIGDSKHFYVWVNEDSYGSASGWVKGADASSLYPRLRALHGSDNPRFIELVKKIAIDHKWKPTPAGVNPWLS